MACRRSVHRRRTTIFGLVMLLVGLGGTATGCQELATYPFELSCPDEVLVGVPFDIHVRYVSHGDGDSFQIAEEMQGARRLDSNLRIEKVYPDGQHLIARTESFMAIEPGPLRFLASAEHLEGELTQSLVCELHAVIGESPPPGSLEPLTPVAPEAPSLPAPTAG